jgi:hypothetical protein
MTDDDLKRLFDAMRQENISHPETRWHFDVAVEHMGGRLDLLAESVAHVDDELGRTGTGLDDKIERTGAETQP